LAAFAQIEYLATQSWADRPEDYASRYRIVTNKFINHAVRTIAHFDPEDPSRNDYRPGTHTLIMWGRPGFQGRKGIQPVVFMLYQPLDGLIDQQGTIHWSPRYFAGYGSDGKPIWAADEARAVPIYGTTFQRSADGGVEWTDMEFDLAGQTTVSWVEPLQRWVMLYGGDLPRWLRYDPETNTEIADAYPEPVPGAIHMRYASHPWGQSTRDAPPEEAWSGPEAVLTREQAAPFLGCDEQTQQPTGCTTQHDPHRPLQMLLLLDSRPNITPSDWPTITQECLAGDALRDVQYNLSGDSAGHLYAPDILDPWTGDVSAAVVAANGERVVDLYWNVSTWNPYGVALVKTELRARPASPSRR
jgi:hypothetical protein